MSRYDDPGQVPVRHVLWPGVEILLTDEQAGVKIHLEDVLSWCFCQGTPGREPGERDSAAGVLSCQVRVTT